MDFDAHLQQGRFECHLLAILTENGRDPSYSHLSVSL